MRAMLAAFLVLASVCVAQAQEALPREDALKAAFQLCRDLPKMLGTPIPTDPDVKRPVGVHAERRGLLILPESKLDADAVAKAGPQAVAIGQLWMLKIVPAAGGQAVPADQLRLVAVSGDNESTTAVLCTLAVHKAPGGQAELLLLGKTKEPLLRASLAPVSEKQDNPIEVSAELQGDGALVTLKILGKFKASFPVAAGE